MTEDNETDYVNLRIRADEQEVLRDAMESKFADSSRISYGGMIRLMASEYIKEEAN